MSGESKESFESFSPAQAREEIKNSFLRRRKLQKLRENFKKSLQAYSDVAREVVNIKNRTNRVVAGMVDGVRRGVLRTFSVYQVQKEDFNDHIEKYYTKKLKKLITKLNQDHRKLKNYETEHDMKKVVPEIVEERQSMYKEYFTDVQEKIKPFPPPRHGRGGKRKKTRRRKRKSHKKRNKGKRKTKRRR